MQELKERKNVIADPIVIEIDKSYFVQTLFYILEAS